MYDFPYCDVHARPPHEHLETYVIAYDCKLATLKQQAVEAFKISMEHPDVFEKNWSSLKRVFVIDQSIEGNARAKPEYYNIILSALSKLRTCLPADRVGRQRLAIIFHKYPSLAWELYDFGVPLPPPKPKHMMLRCSVCPGGYSHGTFMALGSSRASEGVRCGTYSSEGRCKGYLSNAHVRNCECE